MTEIKKEIASETFNDDGLFEVTTDKGSYKLKKFSFGFEMEVMKSGVIDELLAIDRNSQIIMEENKKREKKKLELLPMVVFAEQGKSLTKLSELMFKIAPENVKLMGYEEFCEDINSETVSGFGAWVMDKLQEKGNFLAQAGVAGKP